MPWNTGITDEPIARIPDNKKELLAHHSDFFCA